ncbi:MAG: MoaD/ThiS family protein [Candidatus ainarchaeum sp.]|nr:MoaD/ThiS family protein [Candidatus ainarchaeum sp.]
MKVLLNNEEKKVDFAKGSVGSLLKKMKLAREEVLVKVDGKLVPEDMEVGPRSKIEVIKVVFGG